MSRVRESMTPMRIGPFSVRVWRDEPLEGVIDRDGIYRIGEDMDRSLRLRSPLPDLTGEPARIAKSLLALERVAAVEVVTRSGIGEVWYADWP